MGSDHHCHRSALTAPDLAEAIRAETGRDALAFFDAIAPIIHTDSIDMSVCWFQSRYDKVGPGGTGKRLYKLPDGQGPV
jgi:methylenetetrahydrofolate--tRNA-(uracil-5-)-methyltransferase